jgi:hypothetical protein
MKQILFLVLIGLFMYSCSSSNRFVRIYNLEGRKVEKGNMVSVNDSALQVVKVNGEVKTISYQDIGVIKTKRSAGNNVLKGAVGGLVVGGIVLAASAGSSNGIYTAGDGALAGMVFGLPLGTAIGGITILFKGSKKFQVDGNINRWKEFERYAELSVGKSSISQ